jgi:hypothetical protein
MLHILREQFPDRIMSEDDLDAVADVWRTWCGATRWRGTPYQWLELRLWAFARNRRGTLVALLRKGLDDYGLQETPVELPDPDTISFSTPPIQAPEPLPRGLWLDLVRSEEFAGLPLMIRLTMGQIRSKLDKGPTHSTGFVLIGAMQKVHLQLKAIWPYLPHVQQLEPFFHNAVWQGEWHVLHALDEFHQTGRSLAPLQIY